MARFTKENAAEYGRRGGRRSHQRSEAQYADLVIADPAAAEHVARLIQQGHRLSMALWGLARAKRITRTRGR